MQNNAVLSKSIAGKNIANLAPEFMQDQAKNGGNHDTTGKKANTKNQSGSKIVRSINKALGAPEAVNNRSQIASRKVTDDTHILEHQSATNEKKKTAGKRGNKDAQAHAVPQTQPATSKISQEKLLN
jgi:hypothetical protein